MHSVSCPKRENELADALSKSPMKELDEEQEVKELHRLRKVHEDDTMLLITSSTIEKHQKDSN